MMKRFLSLILITFLTRTASATETIFCNNETYEIQIHVGSDTTAQWKIADVMVYAKDKQYIFTLPEFEKTSIQWPDYKGSFKRNRLSVIKEKEPQLKLEAKGKNGHMTLNGQFSPVECDWMR